jgi:hypothetical protein
MEIERKSPNAKRTPVPTGLPWDFANQALTPWGDSDQDKLIKINCET